MAKKTTNTTSKSDKVEDPKLEERRRLKTLAFSKGLLTRNPAGSKPTACSLQPSKTILKHQGTDVVKKGQRKNRFLFSFPGFIAPVAGGGKIGELSDLATGNPILYLDFPKGRMKLFGTILYPKNKYLTLQFSRKKVLCEDSFDNIIIFSDAWWIGRKEENPEENQLNFPNELNELKHEDCDFKGGACGTNEELTGRRPVNEESNLFEPDVGLTDDTSEGSAPPARDLIQTTPLRQSARMVGKSLNYAENSPEEEFASHETEKFYGSDDLPLDKVISYSKIQMSDSSDDQTLDQVFSASEAQKIGKGDNSNAQSLTTLLKGSFTNISQTSKEFSHDSEGKSINKKCQATKDANQASTSLKNAADKSSNKRGMLVQTTLSTLFGKTSEKKLQHTANDSSMASKGSSRKRQLASSPETKKMVRKPASGKRQKQKQKQVEDDTIEEISSDSEELKDSDAEWAA